MSNFIEPADYASAVAHSMLAFHLAMQNGLVNTETGDEVMRAISNVYLYRDAFEALALPLAVGLLRMLDGYAHDDGASARKFHADVWSAYTGGQE